MLGKKNKWNQIFGRDLLFVQLAIRFGSYDSWGHKGHPKERKEEYYQFLENFAIAMSILSDSPTSTGAVQEQIAWAVTNQPSASGSHVSQWVVSKASAYRAGFLRQKDFADLILMD